VRGNNGARRGRGSGGANQENEERGSVIEKEKKLVTWSWRPKYIWQNRFEGEAKKRSR
jgi:hypothetical protein